MYALLFALFLIATCAFAVWFGSIAERLGAGLVFLAWLSTRLVDFGSTLEPTLVLFVIDVLVFVGLVALVLRYRRFWAGAAACLEALLLAFEGSRLVGFPLSYTAYIAALNISAYGILVALAAGTWAQRWGRRPDEEALD